MRSTSRFAAIALAVTVLAVTACSGADPAATPSVATSDVPVSVSTDGAGEVPRSSTVTPSALPATAPATVPATGPEPIATVAEEGVPGIDSDDPFCRAWSEFAGSFQALAFASIVGTDAEAALELEVAAAPAVIAASDSISASFPPEIADERDVFVDGLLGPFTRRAERARDELRVAGLTDADAAELASLWLVALGDAGINDPDLTVVIPDDLRRGVDAAVIAFGDRVPPIGEDPSLVTDAEAPATTDYLAANCPDQGTLAGNDVID